MRTLTAEGLAHVLAGLPTPNPRIVASGNFATPSFLIQIADEALGEFRLFMLNAQPGVPDRAGVTLETAFVGAGMRDKRELKYYPSRLSLVPVLFRTSCPPDVVFVHTSPPYDGTVSLGVEVNILPAAIEAVRSRGGIVVAQVNPQMPYTFGDGQLPLDWVDYTVAHDSQLMSPHHRPADETAGLIGKRVASLVNDGATLQLGIGAVPDAVLSELHGHRGLRLWSEMFSDGILGLERVGAMDVDHPLIASFCFGSQELYRWVDRNPRIRIKRTEKTNDPATIARQPQMVSVNSALEVDLLSQANASRRGARIYSGFGGQTDFIVGALHSLGGRAIIALASWHPKAKVSTVVPQLMNPVTSFQHTHIVSEQGIAQVWGQSQGEQARQILENVAHPDAREHLRDAAERMLLI